MLDFIKKLIYGRYGVDNLTCYILCFGILFSIVYNFVHWPIFYFISLAASVYALYRIFSKDFAKRQRENEAFQRFLERHGIYPHKIFRRIVDFPRYKYYRCMNCKQTIRIPRGKGRVEIRCPKCGYSFRSKT